MLLSLSKYDRSMRLILLIVVKNGRDSSPLFQTTFDSKVFSAFSAYLYFYPKKAIKAL